MRVQNVSSTCVKCGGLAVRWKLGLIMAAASTALAGHARAQTNGTWAQAGSGTWDVAANWAGSVIPNGGGTATFNGITSVSYTATLLGGASTATAFNTTLSRINFNPAPGGDLTISNTTTGSGTTNQGNNQGRITAANAGLTLDVQDTDSVPTLRARITGNGGITKIGPGTLVLRPGVGNNNYLGVTRVSGGTLEVASTTSTSSSSAIGSGPITVDSGSTLHFSGGVEINTATFTGSAGSELKLTNGRLDIRGSADFNGSVYVGTNAVLNNFGSRINGTFNITVDGFWGVGNTSNQTLTISSGVAGTGTVSFSPTTRVTLTNTTISTSQVILAGGTTRLGNNANFSPSTVVTFSFGVLEFQRSTAVTFSSAINDLQGEDEDGVTGLSNAGTGPVTVGSAISSFQPYFFSLGADTGSTLRFTGSLTGGTLFKDGAGLVVVATDGISAATPSEFAVTTSNAAVRVRAGTLQVGEGGTTGSIGAALVQVDAGAVVEFNRSDALVLPQGFTGAGSLTTSPGGTTLDGPVTLTGTLTVRGPASVARDPGEAPALVGNLVITSGNELDVSDDGLVVRNGDLAAITSLIVSGHLTSSVAGGPGRDAFAGLGVISNDSGVDFGLFESFGGLALEPTDVLVKYTYKGDANFDGTVDAFDLNAFMTGYGSGETGWANGDFDLDGEIDNDDYGLLAASLDYVAGGGLPFAPVVAVGGGVVVPEPGSLITIAPLALLTRRRR